MQLIERFFSSLVQFQLFSLVKAEVYGSIFALTVKIRPIFPLSNLLIYPKPHSRTRTPQCVVQVGFLPPSPYFIPNSPQTHLTPLSPFQSGQLGFSFALYVTVSERTLKKWGFWTNLFLARGIARNRSALSECETIVGFLRHDGWQRIVKVIVLEKLISNKLLSEVKILKNTERAIQGIWQFSGMVASKACRAMMTIVSLYRAHHYVM